MALFQVCHIPVIFWDKKTARKRLLSNIWWILELIANANHRVVRADFISGVDVVSRHATQIAASILSLTPVSGVIALNKSI